MLQQSFELFDKPLFCYKAIHTWHFQSIPSLSSPCDFTCTLSPDVDGSGDSDIHCLKEGGVAVGAHEDITTETASLLSGRRNTDDDTDPFSESEDEEELEANKTAIEDC